MSLVSGTIGAIMGSNASENAANTQAAASNNASQIQLQMFREGLEATKPWREAGAQSLNALQQKMASGPGDYTQSPGYEFRLAEGEKAILRNAAATGGTQGGRTLKALTRFGQDYATNDYDNFLARYYQSLTPYQSMAGIGLTTASQAASQGNAVGAAVGQNMINAGNAQAAGIMNSSNAITGNLSNASSSGVNNYMMWKYLNGGAGAAGAAGANAGLPSAVAGAETIGGAEAVGEYLII